MSNPSRELDEYLSQSEAMWTVVRQAHAGTADDLFQEFALRLLRGDFKRADPERGKFRRFVKTSLYHLVVDHQRRRHARPLLGDVSEPVDYAQSLAESDARFMADWRAELLRRTGQALAEHDRQTGQRLFAVLRLRTDQPQLRSAEMAERLTAEPGQEVNAGWVRKRLHLACSITAARILRGGKGRASATQEAIPHTPPAD